MFDHDLTPELKAKLQQEFEAGLVEKDATQWSCGEFLKKSEEGVYRYNRTGQLWYNFLEVKRSWPEDFEHGEYMHRCVGCSQRFFGHKRRSVCKICVSRMNQGDKPKMSDPKQVILVRKDLEMSVGKLAAQVAHASVACVLELGKFSSAFDDQRHITRFAIEMKDGDAVHYWLTKSFPKITLQVKNERELQKYYDAAVAAGLPASLIVDHGRTEFNGVPTPTCVGIGPADREAIDAITKRLRVFS